MKKHLLTICCLLLAACQPPPTIKTYDPLAFNEKPTFFMNVANVEVDNQYTMPLVRPYIEHLMPISLTQSVNQWANDRIQAVGSKGEMELTILEASVVEVELPVKTGFKGAITNDQAQRYDATLIVEARLFDGERALSASNARVEVRQSRSIAENASIEDREKLFYDITKGMMQLFDAEMDRQIHQHFNAHIQMKR